MLSATLAQWLLARISTPDRASAVVGDLLEQHISTVRFWLTVIRVGFALTWRWILAIGLSAASFFVFLLPYSVIVQPRRDFSHPQSWMTWAMYLFGAATCIGTSTAVAASLYGMRDQLTKMCATVWILVVASAFAVWLPNAQWIIVSLLSATCVVMLSASRTRGLLLCALASAAAFALTYLCFGRILQQVELDILVYVMHVPERSCCNGINGFSSENVARVGLEMTFAVTTWLTSIFLAALVLTRLRRILLHQTASELTSTFGLPD
jgi:hypothetical protein